MSIFSTILSKLGFANKAQAAEVPSQEAPTTAEVSPAAATEASPEVDVVAVCDELAAKTKEKLNWKTSIVDLLKLLGIDSSLANRKALAQELKCPVELIGGDFSKMNMWLHKAVMQELAKNGGKVPDELKS